MDDTMMYALIFGLFVSFLIYKIIRIEYFEEQIRSNVLVPQKYNSTHVLHLLNQFICKLNNEKKEELTVYNIIKIKKNANKIYIKLFIQNKQKQYVRQYYIQGKIPFNQSTDPTLLMYHEHGIQEDIKNGVTSFKETAQYAEPVKYNYVKSNEQQSNTETIQVLGSIGVNKAQTVLGI